MSVNSQSTGTTEPATTGQTDSKPKNDPATPVTDIYDQSNLFEISKTVEKDLGDQFMRALHRLDTAFTLPEACVSLSKSLHSWREEVEVVFPWRAGNRQSKTTRRTPAPDNSNNAQRNIADGATTKSDEGLGLRLVGKTRPYLGIRFVSKRDVYINNQTWHSFYEESRGLSQSLLNFLFAINYLSDHQRTWCATATGEFMVTLEEMCLALGPTIEDFLHPKEDMDLRKFIAVRLGICQTQLTNLLEAMGDYERNEINHIQIVQNREFEGLRNVTSVSTFFAGVVAVTLQFSLTADQTIAFIIINAFWISSLVFSIGSALNCFLGMKMRKVASMSPLSRQPALIKIWVRQSELTLLVISIITYAIGLAVYVIKSQHSVVSIITCVGASGCAIGIGVVWGHHVFKSLNLKRGRRRATREASSEGGDTQRYRPRPSSDPEPEQLFRPRPEGEHHGIMSAVLTHHERHQKTIEIGDETKGGDSGGKDVPGTITSAGVNMVEELAGSDKYMELLKRICEASDAGSDPFDHFKRGEIVHMRCSPNGRWIAICHKHACVVYDLMNVKKHFVLHADEDRRSAEHSVWTQDDSSSEKGNTFSTLLTRSEKELRLWKIPNTTSQVHSIEYEKRYHLKEGHCKYVKCLSEQEFLVLSDRGTLYRVDIDKGAKEATLLMQTGPEDYQVTQVHPIVAKKTEWIICLGTKFAELPKGIWEDFEFEGSGVDYILLLKKKYKSTTDISAAPQTSKFFSNSVPFVKGGGPDHDAQRDTYEILKGKIMPRNVRNMKFCKHRQYVIVNYEKNEVGTTAPELWELGFDPDKAEDWTFNNVKCQIFPTPSTPSRTGNSEIETEMDWREASFAGPAHDVIVCGCNGIITFFRFDRQKGPSSLKLVDDSDMPKPDFGNFFHPIFAWGDTASKPLMVATDHDGKGDISVWKVPSANSSGSSAERAVTESRS